MKAIGEKYKHRDKTEYLEIIKVTKDDISKNVDCTCKIIGGKDNGETITFSEGFIDSYLTRC